MQCESRNRYTEESGEMNQHHSSAKAMIAFFCVSCLLLLSPGALALEARPPVGHTNSSLPVLDSSMLLSGMAWPQYQKTVEPLSSIRALVPLRDFIRADDGRHVQYGLNAVLPVGTSENIRNLSWALITGNEHAPTLIVDANGNGVLTDDTRIEFIQRKDGSFAAEQELLVNDAGEEGGQLVLPLLWSARSGEAGLELYRYVWRERRGSIQIRGEEYIFALRTPDSTFDSSDSLMGIDLNQDGKLQFLKGDVEVFHAKDAYLSIAGREYRVSVDRHGGSLELFPTGRKAEARASLEVGTKAPTPPGRKALSGDSGRPLLLNFWSPACGFSTRMAPQLRQAWEDLHGVQFLSITDMQEDDASEFSGRCGHEWPQISGEEGGEFFSLYRVTSVPTYFVIDAKGIIRARGSTLDWAQIRSVLARLLSREPVSSR